MTAQFTDTLPDVAGPTSSTTAALSVPAGDAAALNSTLLRIPVAIQVIIGSARLPLSQVAQLAPGSTITLDEKLGSEARILVNGREVARGELYVLEGEEGRLGITITQVSGAAGQTNL